MKLRTAHYPVTTKKRSSANWGKTDVLRGALLRLELALKVQVKY